MKHCERKERENKQEREKKEKKKEIKKERKEGMKNKQIRSFIRNQPIWCKKKNEIYVVDRINEIFRCTFFT